MHIHPIKQQNNKQSLQNCSYYRRKNRQPFKFTKSSQTIPLQHTQNQFRQIIQTKKNYHSHIKLQLQKLNEFDASQNQEVEIDQFIPAAKQFINNNSDDIQTTKVTRELRHQKKEIEEENNKWSWDSNSKICQKNMNLLSNSLSQLRKKNVLVGMKNIVNKKKKNNAANFFRYHRLTFNVFQKWFNLCQEDILNQVNDEDMKQKIYSTINFIKLQSLKKIQAVTKGDKLINRTKALKSIKCYRIKKQSIKAYREKVQRITLCKIKTVQLQNIIKQIALMSMNNAQKNKKQLRNKIDFLDNVSIHRHLLNLIKAAQQLKKVKKTIFLIDKQKKDYVLEEQGSLFQNENVIKYAIITQKKQKTKALISMKKSNQFINLLNHNKKRINIKKLLQQQKQLYNTVKIKNVLTNMKDSMQQKQKINLIKNYIFLHKYVKQMHQNLKKDIQYTKSLQRCSDKNLILSQSLFPKTTNKKSQICSIFRKVSKKYQQKQFILLLRSKMKESKKLKLTSDVLKILHTKNIVKTAFNGLLLSRQISDQQLGQDLVQNHKNQQLFLENEQSNSMQINCWIENIDKDERAYEQEMLNLIKRKRFMVLLTKLRNICQLNNIANAEKNILLGYNKNKKTKFLQNLKQQYQFQRKLRKLNQMLYLNYLNQFMSKVKQIHQIYRKYAIQEKDINNLQYKQHKKILCQEPILSIKNSLKLSSLKRSLSYLKQNRQLSKKQVKVTKLYISNYLNKMVTHTKYNVRIKRLLNQKHKDLQNYRVQNCRKQFFMRFNFFKKQSLNCRAINEKRAEAILQKKNNSIESFLEKFRGNFQRAKTQREKKAIKFEDIMIKAQINLNHRLLAEAFTRILKIYTKQLHKKNSDFSQNQQLNQLSDENPLLQNQKAEIKQNPLIQSIDNCDSSQDRFFRQIKTTKKPKSQTQQLNQKDNKINQNAQQQQEIYRSHSKSNSSNVEPIQNEFSQISLSEQDSYQNNYFRNRYDQVLMSKTFRALKINRQYVIEKQALNDKNMVENKKQQQQKYNLVKKCWEGLRLYSKQKITMRKYLKEYQNLQKYSFYPSSEKQLNNFKQIVSAP